ncbi:hypothetical protein [Planktothrix sp. FACHB-1365]|uniref:hypothetical protein n=1 Tax=Planktothrix sp. FACHB-1365 TaxID=2692855 RepID=UPI00168971B8|nr:hypothetical protein [Planktothrix sp. FACHB-1365]MBD2485596.1 hypothetical protein [Planktothrix sp. FACHB-1365]
MVGKLRIRDDQLDRIQGLINCRGMITLRWEFAQYRIQEILTKRGKDIKQGLNEEELNDLYQEEVIEAYYKTALLGILPELKNQRLTLDEIQSRICEKVKGGLNMFLDDYLNIRYNSRGSWLKFTKGEKFIEPDCFQLFCEFLELNWQDVGISKADYQEDKLKVITELEMTLSNLNHSSQFSSYRQYRNLTRSSVFGFKVTNIKTRCIHLFWLLKRLLKQNCQNCQIIDIDFNSNHSYNYDLQHQLTYACGQLAIRKTLLNRIKAEQQGKISSDVSEEVVKQLQRQKKNLLFLLWTSEANQIEQLDEFVKSIGRPLNRKLKTLQKDDFCPQIFFVWVDLAFSSEQSSIDLFKNNISIASEFYRRDLLDWIEEEKIITQMSNWKRGLSFSQDPEKFLDQVWQKVQIEIPVNFDKIEPEIVLETFYKFTLNEWQEHKDQWLKL